VKTLPGLAQDALSCTIRQ